MIPFRSDFPERLAMMVKPKVTREKNSQGPNFRAISAKGGVKNINTKALMSPPKNEAQMPRHRAVPGSPRLAMGWPSKTVATEDGVPGIPRRIPEIWPPASPPTSTPSMAERP